MKKYLDINSLINSDFYKKNQRISWHISHLQYDQLTHNIYNLFEKLKFDGRDDEIFQLAKHAIYKDMSAYLSHIYDYVILSLNNIQPIYSDKSNIYIDNIWKKKKLSFLPSFNLGNKKGIKNFIKKLYQILVENIPKFFFKYIVLERNPLIKDFLINKYTYLRMSYPSYLLLNKSENKLSKILSQKISAIIVSMIEEKYFKLEEDHKQSINFIIEKHLSNADNDLKNYDGFLKNTQNIILGTNTNYYSRLISTIARNHNTNIWKFDHGGERCFFDDDFYWNSSFFNTNVFVTYGKKWKKFVERKAKDLNKDIEVKAIGSSKFQNIFDKFFKKKLKNDKKILYIPAQFVSEEREFPYSKIIDPVLYDWQKYLIETIQNFQYKVIYKTHPKGKLHADNNLGKIANHNITGSMIESLSHTDTVILDSAGSAFVEALCAGKDVIYIDMKQRPFDKENFKEFNTIVKIVSTYIKDGVYYLNLTELENALNSQHKDIKKQEQVVKDYWLNI